MRYSMIGAILVAAIGGGCTSSQQKYFADGAGSRLGYQDMAASVDSEDAYIALVCRKSTMMTDPKSQCQIDSWLAFTYAGMNDIDERCDDYLSWLDVKRRNAGAILSEIADAQTLTSSVLTASQVSTATIGTVIAAFGFARSSFENANSRLLLEVDHTTVQSIVTGSQLQFRNELKNYSGNIDSRPMAIYVLRQYLRSCMPYSIEAKINNAASLLALASKVEVIDADGTKSNINNSNLAVIDSTE